MFVSNALPVLTRLLAAMAVVASFVIASLTIQTAAAETNPPPVVQARDGEFSSVVLITSDADWLAKWNTPTADTPLITPVRELRVSDAATVLVLFAGATEAKGRLQAVCAIEVRKPDGTASVAPEAPCYDEKSLGQRMNILMANARVEFKVEADDPAGWWRFRVMVRDANSSARTDSEIGVLVVKEGMRP